MYTCTQTDEGQEGKITLCVLTVHDSIVVDVHPDEKDIVKEILIDAMENVATEVKVRFNYEMVIPLAIEIKSGSNWLNGNVIYGQ
jgi:DNA polymerase I-like protein with 3'-5' exonuclease and polymerase domains